MGAFADLPTLADVQRTRRAMPKGQTRLALKIEKTTRATAAEKTFRAQVIARDGKICRCCGRRVVATIALVANRLEVHHIHGRASELRYESRCAVVLCKFCHERVTGTIGRHRLFVFASQTFGTVHGIFTDATYPVTFRELP